MDFLGPFVCVYTEKAPNAWHRRGTQRQETATLNPNDRQPTQLSDQALLKGQPGSQDV